MQTLWSETFTLWKQKKCSKRTLQCPKSKINHNKSRQLISETKTPKTKTRRPTKTTTLSSSGLRFRCFLGIFTMKKSRARGNSPDMNRNVRIIEFPLKFDKRNKYTKHSLVFFCGYCLEEAKPLYHCVVSLPLREQQISPQSVHAVSFGDNIISGLDFFPCYQANV